MSMPNDRRSQVSAAKRSGRKASFEFVVSMIDNKFPSWKELPPAGQDMFAHLVMLLHMSRSQLSSEHGKASSRIDYKTLIGPFTRKYGIKMRRIEDAPLPLKDSTVLWKRYISYRAMSPLEPDPLAIAD
jgi:hypothetical protein